MVETVPIRHGLQPVMVGYKGIYCRTDAATDDEQPTMQQVAQPQPVVQHQQQAFQQIAQYPPQ